MFTKKILIDLDGVLNEYGKEKYNENTVITNLNILSYAEKLKSALEVCKNGGLND